MATHSSILSWRIPGTGEPGGLPSMGSLRVGHYCLDLAVAGAAELSYTPSCGCALIYSANVINDYLVGFQVFGFTNITAVNNLT